MTIGAPEMAAPWKPKKREIPHSVRNDESQNFSAGCKSHRPKKTGVLTNELLVGAADFFQDGWICFGSGTGPRG